MNRFDALRIFCIAAESLNFRDAATRLGISPQVITRVVKKLEEEIGEPLFHRSTRGVRLTHFGESFALRSAQAIAGIDDIFSSSLASAHDELSGVVRIATPGALGRRFITRGLAPLLAQHPQLIVDLRLSEILADVVDEQIDIGVRIGPVRDNRFIARSVSTASLHFVAAPALLKRIGTPANRDALLQAPLTTLIDRNTGRPWPLMFNDGDQHIPTNPVFITDDPESECEAVAAGIGIGQLPGHLALPLLREGYVVTLLDRLNPPPSTLYVYRPHRTPVPARVRLVFDALCAILEDCEKPQHSVTSA
ncbi:LysR family transcriptional regulator [Paraburkholderia sp. ZP32-5]|uniref:LysR family transcriptional regulator n=1 Tax=Paraburkholderia sp. ZP32-5 TaxID=2883245 RepID=UPI001F32B140|nr:LysR family transcriptional regulator [Paraburkholderia sp. ZP32-5]